MNVYVYANRGGPELLAVMNILKPSLPDFLRADREGIRKAMALSLGEGIFKRAVYLRFEDECEECWEPIDTDRPYGPRCSNPKWEKGSPPTPALQELILNHGPRRDETAVHYYDRLTVMWRSNCAAATPTEKPEAVTVPDNQAEVVRLRQMCFEKHGMRRGWEDEFATAPLESVIYALYVTSRQHPRASTNLIRVIRALKKL